MPWWYRSRRANRGLPLALVVVLLALAGSPLPALAAGKGWEVPLIVSAGRAELHLAFGRKKGATSGVDGLFEVPALPRGILRGGFLLGGHPYWRDIRGLGAAPCTWVLHLSGVGRGKRVALRWKRNLLPPGRGVYLADPVARQRIDMEKREQYAFTSNGPRTLRIEMGDSGANK